MLVRKFYDVKKEGLVDEGRVSGDGESCTECNESGLPYCERERVPGDGCFSDIAEEDEEGEVDDDNFVAEEDEGIEDLDDDFYECDELDEAGKNSWYARCMYWVGWGGMGVGVGTDRHTLMDLQCNFWGVKLDSDGVRWICQIFFSIYLIN